MKGTKLFREGKMWYDVNAIYEILEKKRDKQTIRYWLFNEKVPSIKINGKRFVEERYVWELKKQVEEKEKVSFKRGG
jgi:hypothetical protein